MLAGRCLPRPGPHPLAQLLRTAQVMVAYSIALVKCRDELGTGSLLLALRGLLCLHSAIRAWCSKSPGQALVVSRLEGRIC